MRYPRLIVTPLKLWAVLIAVTVYPTWLRLIITFLAPIAVAATMSSQAPRGDLAWWQVFACLGAGAASVLVALQVWGARIRRYSGAGSWPAQNNPSAADRVRLPRDASTDHHGNAARQPLCVCGHQSGGWPGQRPRMAKRVCMVASTWTPMASALRWKSWPGSSSRPRFSIERVASSKSSSGTSYSAASWRMTLLT